MSRWLIIFGVALIAGGLVCPLLQKIGLCRLPEAIVIEREPLLLPDRHVADRQRRPLADRVAVEAGRAGLQHLLWRVQLEAHLLQRAQQSVQLVHAAYSGYQLVAQLSSLVR